MKKFLVLSSTIIVGLSLNAQDATVKDLQSTAMKEIKTDSVKLRNGWAIGALLNINIAQVSNYNWVSAGGDKFSLSAGVSFDAFARKKWGRQSWDNVLSMKYGIVNTTTLGLRKVADGIDFITKVSHQPHKWKHTRLSVLGQFRSQFANGYDYDYFDTDVKRRISGFFAPAYITLAPGISWDPNNWFSLFLSPVSARWTIVSNKPYSYVSQGGIYNGNQETPLATLYGVDPEEGQRFEFGAFLTASANKDISKNVKYIGKIDLYSNYLENPQNIDVYWTNKFLLTVNKWIKVSYNLDLLYDDDTRQPKSDLNPDPNSVGLQVLSTLGVGIALKY